MSFERHDAGSDAGRFQGGATRHFENVYCSKCLCTKRFLDLGSHLVCERCSKHVERISRTAQRSLTLSEARSPARWTC